MLLTNPFTHDTRVDTQARTLVEWGYDVHIVCLAKQNLATRECNEGLTVHRVEIRARSIPRVLQGILRMSDSERIGAWLDQPLDQPLDEPLDDSSASATGLAGPGFWSRLGERGAQFLPGAFDLIGLNDELARAAYALNPELVIAHDCDTLLAGKMLKSALGCWLVYDSHELFLERNIGSGRRWFDKLWWSPIERGCIGSADACFAVAGGIAEHLERRYHLAEVHVLRNVQKYQPAPIRPEPGEASALHVELGLDSNTKIVMYPGLITPHRGIETLIRAAPDLDDAVFVVMGGMGGSNSEQYMSGLIDLAESNGSLNTSVFFKEPVPPLEVGRWVAMADLGIVPTQGVCQSYLYELSNKMFHCIMAGVPLAMSRHPEKTALNDRYKIGVLFDETSVESVVRVVNETLSDPGKLRVMRANCLKAAQILNWEHEQRVYSRVISELLPKPEPI